MGERNRAPTPSSQQKGDETMKKVENEALVRRLNEIYAQKQAGRKKEGIETRQKKWFLDEENRSFCLRVVGKDGEPTTFVDVIPVK